MTRRHFLFSLCSTLGVTVTFAAPTWAQYVPRADGEMNIVVLQARFDQFAKAFPKKSVSSCGTIERGAEAGDGFPMASMYKLR